MWNMFVRKKPPATIICSVESDCWFYVFHHNPFGPPRLSGYNVLLCEDLFLTDRKKGCILNENIARHRGNPLQCSERGLTIPQIRLTSAINLAYLKYSGNLCRLKCHCRIIFNILSNTPIFVCTHLKSVSTFVFVAIKCNLQLIQINKIISNCTESKRALVPGKNIQSNVTNKLASDC